jgi:rod shape-determining protein MreB
MGFFDFMTEDIAMNLGTANTLINNDKVVIDNHPLLHVIEFRVDNHGWKRSQHDAGKTHENIKR